MFAGSQRDCSLLWCLAVTYVVAGGRDRNVAVETGMLRNPPPPEWNEVVSTGVLRNLPHGLGAYVCVQCTADMSKLNLLRLF